MPPENPYASLDSNPNLGVGISNHGIRKLSFDPDDSLVVMVRIQITPNNSHILFRLFSKVMKLRVKQK